MAGTPSSRDNGKRLQGKVALISGGARGMGASQARLLAREGAAVCVADVLEEPGRALATEIEGSGGEALFIKLDVTLEEEWTSAVEIVRRHFGKLDVLVNNAGIVRNHSIEEATAEDWDTLFDVNAKGVFLGTRAAIPAMRAAGGGSIVNISSVAAIIAHVRLSIYSASKSAVRMLTKCTAVEYAKENIRANSVHPGPIDTPMVHAALAELEARGATGAEFDPIPLGRIGSPGEVAAGVLYLASDESSYVTGSELVIDGGMSVFR